MIELKNVCVKFGDTQVLKNFSARIDAGDFITIVGANGAGKSTLFDLIAGKIMSQEGVTLLGEIFIDGTDVTQLDEQKRAHFIARLFQNPLVNTVQDMTVEQNIALATCKGRRVSMRDAMRSLPKKIVLEELLQPFCENIDQLLAQPVSTLSGGQRQMIAFVMATLCPPKILLLDEPTAALDPQAAAKMLSLAVSFIKKHAITTLLITHDQRIASEIGNKMWILQDGVVGQEVCR